MNMKTNRDTLTYKTTALLELCDAIAGRRPTTLLLQRLFEPDDGYVWNVMVFRALPRNEREDAILNVEAASPEDTLALATDEARQRVQDMRDNTEADRVKLDAVLGKYPQPTGK